MTKLWSRILIGIAALVVLLAGTVAGLRYWITTDGGRNFVAARVDGMRAGPMGVIRVSGLTGDPLTSAGVADLAFVDEDGVWLRIRDANVTWRPFDLLSGRLEIDTANIRLVDVQRRPRVQPQPSRGGGVNIGVTVTQLDINELRIAEGVAGPAASFRIGGGGGLARDRSGFLRLGAAPLDGPGDRAIVQAEWSAEGMLAGTANMSGPAEGVLANLLQAPDNAAVQLNATAAGGVENFTADVRLAFGDMTAATLSASRRADAIALDASLKTSDWPLLAPVHARAGETITIAGRGSFVSPSAISAVVDVQTHAGSVELTGEIDTSTGLSSPLRIVASGLDLAMLASPLSGRVDATGVLDVGGGDGVAWRGDVVANDLAFPSGSARRVTGPLEAAWRGSTLSWLTPGMTVENGRITPLSRIAPARYDIATRGEVSIASMRVEIHQAQVRGAPGDASARGSYAISSGALDLAGSVRLARLSDVSPLTGAARGQWSVRRASQTAPIRITADMTGQTVDSGIAALATLMGEAPRVTMTAVVQDRRFVVESSRIIAQGLDARIDGRVTPSGEVTGRALATLTRPIDAGAVRVAGANITALMSGRVDNLRVTAQLGDAAISSNGDEIARLGAETSLIFAERISGDAAINGRVAGRTLELTGRIDGRAGDYAFPDVRGRLGDFSFAAPDMRYTADGFSTKLVADGSIAGIAGISRGTVRLNGEASFHDETPRFNLALRAEDIRREQTRVTAFTLDAAGDADSARMTGRLQGVIGAAIDLGWGTDAQRNADGGWAGAANLSGVVEDLPVTTVTPIVWAWNGGAWDIAAELSALGGALTANLSSSVERADARLELSGIDLNGLSRLARLHPFAGTLTGRAVYANIAGVATSDFSLSATDVNPAGVSQDPVSVSVSGRLRNRQLTATASGSGQGFLLEGDAALPVEIGDGFDMRIAETAPLRASLSLNGRMEPLWAIFGPEDQSLRGRIETSVRVSGSASSLALDGGFTIANAAYDHGETGLRLRNIAAEGQFDQQSARITRLTATDGNSGRISGEGEITWTGELDGEVRFTATDLRALGRDDRSAVVSGTGGVQLDPDAIVVSADLTVSQARISVEQPAAASIPTLPQVRRVNFANIPDEETVRTPGRPVRLDLKVSAPRRIVVFGRGLDMEWGADFDITGPVANPNISGSATLVRGTLDLAGQRFMFDTGSISLQGPIRTARINISASRQAADIDAFVRLSGTPVDPEFVLESSPSLPQDEILARVLFNRSASELSGLETAQLAAALTQLAGGQAAFDPGGLLRDITGLDRVSIGAEGDAATIAAGKYVAENVYVQVGAGGVGGVGAEVEWQPIDNVSIISSARENGDTKIALRWKRDY